MDGRRHVLGMATAWPGCGMLLAGCTLLLGGCGGQGEPGGTPLARDVALYPPTELVRTAEGSLVALVAEGETHALTLYRSDDAGETWARWKPLRAPETFDEVELTCGGRTLAVAGRRERTIWLATLQADPQAPADTLLHTIEWFTDEAVASLALTAAAAEPDKDPLLYLAYLTGDPADSNLALYAGSSDDGGTTWTSARRLAEGNLGRVALTTRAGGGKAAELGYSRDYFFQWRGLSERDHTSPFRVRLRVDGGSRNEIARMDRDVLVVGESDRNQVVCCTSHNGGRNWEPAMALAGASDSRRVPDVAAGFGRFWAVFAAADTAMIARSAKNPRTPKRWSRDMILARTGCVGEPSIVALPDSSAGVLYASSKGGVYFVRVQEAVD